MKKRSRADVLARIAANGPAVTPELPEPTFEDSQIDVVPLDLKRDAVKAYITMLQRDNKNLRQIIDEMNKPLVPKGIAHPARKGRGL